MVKRIAIVVRGREFPTLKAAAAFYGLTLNDVSRRLRWGWTPEQAVGLDPHHRRATRGVAIEWKGKRYPSIRALADAIGESESTVAKRLREGWTVDEAASGHRKRPTTKGTKIEFRGEKFESWTSLAEHHNIGRLVFAKRVKRGWSIEQALSLVDPPPRFRDSQGNARSHLWKEVQRIDGSNLPASDPGTYKLYVVRNKVSRKEYVGITITPLSLRFRGHLAQAKKGTGGKLYSAIRRYGAAAFEIVLIRADACDFRELQDQEIAEIEKRRTLTNGYNLARGGSIGTAKSISVGDREFASWAEAAHHFGIDPTVFNSRITARKWTPEEAAEVVPREKFIRRRTTIEGRTYPSLKAAAEAHGLTYQSVYDRHVSKGWSLEQALQMAPPPDTIRKRGIRVTVRGIEFPSLSACAAHFGISATTLQAIVSAGKLSVENAVRHLQLRPRPGTKRKQR